MSVSPEYADFLARKHLKAIDVGFAKIPPLNPSLFAHQRVTTEFLLKRGRGAAFLDTGLGKTLIQLDWSRVVAARTHKPVLILAPLAVAAQTVHEGERFGIHVIHCQSGTDVKQGVNITNYHKLHKFDDIEFGGVVLDESSILKSFDGATKNALCERFARTPFRICCTATPAPNDHMELGNHAEFLGILSMREMLSRWFINDTSTASQNWRLKGHAREAFWRWVSSWAISCCLPSDLGCSDKGFILPPLEFRRHVVSVDLTEDRNGALFRMPGLSGISLHAERRRTIAQRAPQIAALVNRSTETWLVWCETNYEADAVRPMIPGAIEVRGSDSPEIKETRLVDFSEGRARVLITKPRIAGFGLNWQHCANMIFAGVGFSYESLYQAIRRCWRFGQLRPVNVHLFMAETEIAVWDVLSAKIAAHENMKQSMRKTENADLL